MAQLCRVHIAQKLQSLRQSRSYTMNEKVRYCDTGRDSISTGCVDSTEKLGAKNRWMLASTPSHRLAEEESQMPLRTKTSSTSRNNQRATLEHTMATVEHKSFRADKSSPEYLLAKKRPLAEKSDLQNEKLYKNLVGNLEHWLALSCSFQKPAYWVLITDLGNARTPTTWDGLLAQVLSRATSTFCSYQRAGRHVSNLSRILPFYLQPEEPSTHIRIEDLYAHL